jgi:peptide/nickel transport system ATP-binding protein
MTDHRTADVSLQRDVPKGAHLLEVKDLFVEFRTRDGVAKVINGVSYYLDQGEALAVLGESGSGKSVTAQAIMGILDIPPGHIASGEILFEGRDLLKMSEGERRGTRGRDIAMIFQDALSALNPVYKVGYQISETMRRRMDMSKDAAMKRAIELMDLVRIPAAKQRVNDYPHQFSGGMRQRVMIAMALAMNPKVLIADEPTTALDVTVQAQVLEALEAARAETGAAMVLITHDLGVIAGHTDRICVMYAGKLVEKGSVEDVFYRPRMPYTLGLLGSLPRLDETGRERLTPIVGAPPSLLNLPPGCPFTPRCPLAQERCEEIEPELVVTDSAAHLAACHYQDQLAGVTAADLFKPTSADVESVADLEAQL